MKGEYLIRSERRLEEVREKRRQLAAFLAEKGFEAILLSQHENIAWLTAGLAEVRVGVVRESGAASLLLTRDDHAFYLTTNNEVARVGDEEFDGLEFEPIVNPWSANDVPGTIRKLVATGKVASDKPQFGYEAVSLQPLRTLLTEGEVERYRWLGNHVAQVTADVVLRVHPGMSEHALQAMVAAGLLEQGILPSVFLTAVDERVLKYKHAVPRDGVLKQLAMIGLCARRWGLSVSITRYVQFGAGLPEFSKHLRVAAETNARLMATTREGATGNSLFATVSKCFAEHGFAGEELMHHQGGPAGYLEREWVARPGGTETATLQQAFAWNPNLHGAKIEDTVLLRNGAIEMLTATPQLPEMVNSWQGCEYRSAGLLQQS